MTHSVLKTSFMAGEIAPSLWGMVDFVKYPAGCATLRNCFVNYRGGASSRAGLMFVGQALPDGAGPKPRLIRFQFTVNTSYILEFGDRTLRIIFDGGYVTETPLALTGSTQANPCQQTAPGHGFADGDWLAEIGLGGMVELNGRTVVVANADPPNGTFTLRDTFGDPIDSRVFGAYAGGGTVARIYTTASPYAIEDLPYLKFSQAVDRESGQVLMSFDCVNTQTGTEYPPYNLTRTSPTNWVFTQVDFDARIDPPANVRATASSIGNGQIIGVNVTAGGSGYTQAATTASITTATGTSGAITPIVANGAVVGFTITNGGTNYVPSDTVNITGDGTGADATLSIGSQFQYVVTALDDAGNESVASQVASVASVNIAITAGSITISWDPVDGAVAYRVYKSVPCVGGTTVPIGTSFGLAAEVKGTQFVDSNVIQDFTRTPPLHLNPFAPGQIAGAESTAGGTGYAQETTSVTVNTATGSGAVVLPVVVAGAVVAFIVESGGHGYAPSDTLTVNGAGSGATGTLSVGAQSGTYPGVVEYAQQRRVDANSLNDPDTYNMSQTGRYANFDAGNPPVDSDALSGTPWAQQINGIQWIVVVTGGVLMMTGLGLWKVAGASSIAITPSSQEADPQEYNGISPLVRPIRIKQDLVYLQDKGNIVNSLEFNFYNNTFAGADISVPSNHLFEGRQIVAWDWAQEPWKILWAVRNDGRFLSLTYIKDQKIAGWGRHDTNGLAVDVAVASEPPVDAPYFLVRRYIPAKARFAYYVERMDDRVWANAEEVWALDCALSLTPAEPNATLMPAAATGTGVSFKASTNIFDGVTIGAVGNVIRVGGGKATVTAYVSPVEVLADIVMPITATMPNDPSNRPLPAEAGAWSVAAPVTTIRNLDHLEGAIVGGLLDGAVMTPQAVVNGAITVPAPGVTKGVVGLPFVAQAQTLYPEIPGQETIQGDRKKVASSKLRFEKSRGVKVGTNQPNASAQENQAEIPWGQGTQLIGKLREIPDIQVGLLSGSYLPLVTGDYNVNVDGDWDVTGMVALQQDYPLPMNVLLMVAEMTTGDTAG